MIVDAPEDLQIVEDGRVLGSSASGKVALDPGSHLIEIRNDSLGFQATRTVQVLPGKTVRVSIAAPGREPEHQRDAVGRGHRRRPRAWARRPSPTSRFGPDRTSSCSGIRSTAS